jgi:hypothetical protein
MVQVLQNSRLGFLSVAAFSLGGWQSAALKPRAQDLELYSAWLLRAVRWHVWQEIRLDDLLHALKPELARPKRLAGVLVAE